jgi:hypothetical protein
MDVGRYLMRISAPRGLLPLLQLENGACLDSPRSDLIASAELVEKSRHFARVLWNGSLASARYMKISRVGLINPQMKFGLSQVKLAQYYDSFKVHAGQRHGRL